MVASESASSDKDTAETAILDEDVAEDAGTSVDVSRSATVVRVVKTPFHLRGAAKNRLKPAAFRPPAGSNEISVVQQGYAGDDYCKSVGHERAGEAYIGLAPARVDDVLEAGAQAVLNTPEGNYPGHADIISPRSAPPKGEVLAAEDAKVMTDFCDALVEKFKYHMDPDLEGVRWMGPPLLQTSM